MNADSAETEGTKPFPDCAIKLDGFPLCVASSCCPSEVRAAGQKCPWHGGEEFTNDIWLRMLLRQLRSVTKEYVDCCGDIRGRKNSLAACDACKVRSGAAWALGGLIERMGHRELSEPYLAMTLEYVPGGRW